MAFSTRCYILYEARVNRLLPDAEPDASIRVESLRPTQLGELTAVAPYSGREELHRRLERGDRCLVARREGRVASYVWLTCSDHWDPELRIKLETERRKCIGYDAYTVPDARGLGIRQRLHVEERRSCRELGRDTLVFWLEEKVAPRAVRRWAELGLRQHAVARVRTYRVLGRWRWSRVRPLQQ